LLPAHELALKGPDHDPDERDSDHRGQHGLEDPFEGQPVGREPDDEAAHGHHPRSGPERVLDRLDQAKPKAEDEAAVGKEAQLGAPDAPEQVHQHALVRGQRLNNKVAQVQDRGDVAL
jgi:hypothetical protein